LKTNPLACESILTIENLVKKYSGITAVKGISFSIKKGVCFGLLGPNGAGKTTTIEVIEGIISPSSGTVLYKGEKRGKRFREEIGIQLQNTELPRYLTVKQTLDMFRNLYGKKADFNKLVRICQLGEILNRDNNKISGGQKQRLLLAMALANDPELIFLDEPTTGLDPQARRNLWAIVNGLKKKGKTIILTTHYMEEAQLLCDIIAIMDQGKIIARGSPDYLLSTFSNESVITLPSGEISKEILDAAALVAQGQGTAENNFHTTNSDNAIRVLQASGISLQGVTIRSGNLEDIFLSLTGHKLRN
jgi:ABC-2 type transport system ATP-binding protein